MQQETIGNNQRLLKDVFFGSGLSQKIYVLFVLRSDHSRMSGRAEYNHQSRTNILRRIFTRSASHARACRKLLIGGFECISAYGFL